MSLLTATARMRNNEAAMKLIGKTYQKVNPVVDAAKVAAPTRPMLARVKSAVDLGMNFAPLPVSLSYEAGSFVGDKINDAIGTDWQDRFIK